MAKSSKEPVTMPVKVFSLFLAILMVLNFIAFAFSFVSVRFFWMLTIFCAAMTYWGIPYLKKLNKSIK